jgi:hypothetical protein
MATLLDLVSVQVAEEAVDGTEAASFKPWPGRVSSMSITPQNEEIMVADISSRDEAEFLLHGKENFPWEIEFSIQNWIWVYWAFGAVVDSGVDPYTHATTLANTIPPLSIEPVFGNGDFSIKLLGCKVNTFDLTIVSGEIPKVKLTGFAKSGFPVDTTPGVPGKLTTVPIQWHQTSTLNINSIDQKCKVERAQYQYKNGVSEEYGICDIAPSEIIPGTRGLVANYTLRVENESIYELRSNYTDFAISHVITRAVNDTFTLTIPSAKTFKPARSSPGGGGAFRMSLPCKAQTTTKYSASAVDSIAVYTDPV